MLHANKLFKNKKLRAAWDKDRKVWWVSVIDLIVALRDTDYDTARNYWKQQKYRMNGKAKKVVSKQLKLTCKDGRQRYTDVMRYKDIILLIQKLPANSTAGVLMYKKYIGETAMKVSAFVGAFNEAVNEVCVKQVFRDRPMLKTTVVSRVL